MQLLTESLITSFFIIGLFNATEYSYDREGNPDNKKILWWFRYGVKKYVNEAIGKPIILCPKCMASIWGVIFYFGVFQHGIDDALFVVVFIPIVSAMSWMIYLYMNR